MYLLMIMVLQRLNDSQCSLMLPIITKIQTIDDIEHWITLCKLVNSTFDNNLWHVNEKCPETDRLIRNNLLWPFHSMPNRLYDFLHLNFVSIYA